MTTSTERFDGWIGGIGTTSGLRLVVGHWPSSPYGASSDVMLEHPDGHRVLLAPTQQVADFVAGTYTFDEVRLVPVAMHVDATTAHLDADGLTATLHLGRRPALGLLLRAVPTRHRPSLDRHHRRRRATRPAPVSAPSAPRATTAPSTTARATCTASPTPPSTSATTTRAR